LSSLPWVAPDDFELELPPDPFADRETLSDFPRNKPTRKPDDIKTDPTAQQVIHTALALEVREGILYAFLPPLTSLEAWLELLAALEDCAEKLNQPLRLEGYPPPRDPRLLSLSVTPDPGVIEVNIHPADSWDALESRTQTLYEDARQTRWPRKNSCWMADIPAPVAATILLWVVPQLLKAHSCGDRIY
jgi:uncharacterized protein (DUF2126 family)